ncbi:MAG: hypothetical protein R3A78_03115 [Polyangiales bacterium]
MSLPVHRANCGQVSVELLAVSLVALVGAGAMGALGDAFVTDITDSAAGGPPGMHANGRVLTAAHADHVSEVTVGRQAGTAELVHVAEAWTRTARRADEALLASVPRRLVRYGEQAVGLDLATAPARWREARQAMGSRIEWGMEVESMRLDALFDWYGPEGVMDRTKRLLHPASARQRAVDDGFRSLVKRAGAPEELAMDVTPEFDVRDARSGEIESRIFELRSEGGLPTQHGLMNLANRVQAQVGGSMQWHLSFVPDGNAAPELIALLRHLDERDMLRSYAESAHWVSYSHRGPYVGEELERIGQAIRTGNVTFTDEIKPRFVGFRTEKYGEPNRVGFEFRALPNDLRDAARTLDAAATALEHPQTGSIALGDRSIPLSRLRGEDHLTHRTYTRMAPDHQAVLMRAHHAEAPGQESAKLVDRWAVPLVHWESRSYLADRADDIRAARDAYVARVDALIGESPRYQREALDDAVHAWAKSLRLDQAF